MMLLKGRWREVCKIVVPPVLGSFGIENLHVNTLFEPIVLDLIGISIGLKGVVYSFSNPIERTCKHLIGLKKN